MQEPGDRSLTSALRALADDDAKMGASTEIEGRLLAEVRSIARARQRRLYSTVLALAAALLLAVAVPLWWTMGRAPVSGGSATAGEPLPRHLVTAFYPLTYSAVPFTDARIVRLEVPQQSVETFGLAHVQLVAGSSSGTVLADVLVGEDGLARAVRFVRPRINQEQRR